MNAQIDNLFTELDPQVPGIMDQPIGEAEKVLLSFQLLMTRAAMCHAYAMMEYDSTICVMRRGELQDEMDTYRSDYQSAKGELARHDLALAQDIETDLHFQKQIIFSEYLS
jgi:hypothetical protein